MHFYTFAYLKGHGVLDNGWILEKNDENFNRAQEICKLLENDENSIAHYIQFLWWKTNNIERLFDNYPVLSNKKYFKSGLIKHLSDNESFLDLGAYRGKISKDFIDVTNGRFNRIWAIEPEEESYRELSKKFTDSRIDCFNCAINNGVDEEAEFLDSIGMAAKISAEGNTKCLVRRIDDLHIRPSIIKIHIEGNELDALYSGETTITNSRPIIMVIADHNIDGFYDLPMFINRLVSYSLFFRVHDYCGNSAVYYFIPNERM